MSFGRGVFLALAAVMTVEAGAEPIRDDLLTTPGVAYETYLVRWWGAPGSEMTRPIYRIARFDTDAFELHYGIVPGRALSNYTMPYWPVRSFLSFVDGPAELAQELRFAFRAGTETRNEGFVPRSGVELAPSEGALALRIRNRSIGFPEDITVENAAENVESNPLSLEQLLVLRKNADAVPVRCTVTNTGGAEIEQLSVSVTFAQSFSWGRFGVSDGGAYATVSAPVEGEARTFYAFSEGMKRGYEFIAAEGARLQYALEPEMNAWRVTISYENKMLSPAAAQQFDYALRVLKAVPDAAGAFPPPADTTELVFTRVQPSSFKTAPVQPERRVSIRDMVANVEQPKVRGLNLNATFPQAFDDLETLRDWGCNLVIANLGGPDTTAQFIERGHALGMEMLLAGRGSYHDGPPSFDAYYEAPRTAEQLPDAHGQDEDHYYWAEIPPALDFEERFGKPMALATQEAKVAYWADCFAEKWRGVQTTLKPHAPDAGVWFYAPFPGVAHVDPIDSYGTFLSVISHGLGDALTVFPFYYGIEYNQCEYMMRRWKDAGARRAVFLPMRAFMTKPSQFLRAITAARRGGADGACGFAFGVSSATPENQWQWKAVMLGALANFPTPDMDAISLMEEPAELVEALGEGGLVLRVVSEAEGFDAQAALAPVFEALPDARQPAEASETARVTIVVTAKPELAPEAEELWNAQKGFVQFDGATVRISGADATALSSACGLLSRFADIARDE